MLGGETLFPVVIPSDRVAGLNEESRHLYSGTKFELIAGHDLACLLPQSPTMWDGNCS